MTKHSAGQKIKPIKEQMNPFCGGHQQSSTQTFTAKADPWVINAREEEEDTDIIKSTP